FRLGVLALPQRKKQAFLTIGDANNRGDSCEEDSCARSRSRPDDHVCLFRQSGVSHVRRLEAVATIRRYDSARRVRSGIPSRSVGRLSSQLQCRLALLLALRPAHLPLVNIGNTRSAWTHLRVGASSLQG